MFTLTKISDAPLTKCSTDINDKDVQHVLKILKNKKNIRTAEIHTAYSPRYLHQVQMEDLPFQLLTS